MSAPGVTITTRDTPPPRSAPTDTGVWFAAGITEKGPTTPTLIQSLDDFVAKFGQRLSNSLLYDSVETFFREGGSRCYVCRVVGPSPALATITILDGSSAITLYADALSYGSWGNALNVVTAAGDQGGEFKLTVTHDTDGTLETSPSLVDQAAAIAWAANSSYIRLRAGASSLDPATGATRSLAGGDDDSGSATDATWKAALDRAGADLGPGQVSMPGRTTTQAHTDTLAHAAANNRRAILDAPDTATVATLTAAAAAQRSGVNAGVGALFAPWAVVPGLTPGTTRTVPYSAVQAGLIARSDGLGNSPNVPAAGENGVAVFATDLSQVAWTDAERATLNDAGVNVARVLYGVPRTYGYRTLADPVTKPLHLMFNNVREDMNIIAKAGVILEGFVLRQIDGRGHLLSRLNGQLTAMLNAEYEADALYGDTPQDAFNVNTGGQVNTPTTIAQGVVKAVIAIKRSPEAERVELQIVRVAVDGAVA